MEYILYTEINIVCIFLLIMLLCKMLRLRKINKSYKYYTMLLIGNIFFFLTDSLWGIVEGKIILASFEVYYLINWFYSLFSAIVSYLCFLYIESIHKKHLFEGKYTTILSMIPITILLILLIINGWTGWLFFIDDEGMYHRGILYFVQLICTYGYLVVTGIVSIYNLISNPNKNKIYKITITFLLYPLTFGAGQIILVDMPLLCVGMTLGLLQLYLYIIASERERDLKDYNAVMEALSYGYTSYTIIDWETDQCVYYRTTDEDVEVILDRMLICKTYGEAVKSIYSKFIHVEERQDTLEKIRPEAIRRALSHSRKYDVTYQRIVNGMSNYIQASYVLVERDNERKEFIMVTRNVDELVKMKEKIYLDQLTGLNNRNGLYEYFQEKRFELSKDKFLYLLIMDANKFKFINDTYGHNEGDNALMRIASVLKKVGRKHDALAVRYGGDEFILIGEGHKENEIDKICGEIHQTLLKVNQVANVPYELSVSIGYAKYTTGNLEDFIENADQRLYKIKRARQQLCIK